MKNIFSVAILGISIATAPQLTDARSSNSINQSTPAVNQNTPAVEKTVCNSDIAVKNAKYRIFTLIQWPETGKNRLTYCYLGEKVFSAPIVTGRPHKDGGVYTPEGNFSIGVLDKNRVSKKYDAPMPNSVHVYKGIFIHQGKTTNSKWELLKYASHGCVRLNRENSEKFYNFMQQAKEKRERVEVIIQGTNPRTEKDGK